MDRGGIFNCTVYFLKTFREIIEATVSVSKSTIRNFQKELKVFDTINFYSYNELFKIKQVYNVRSSRIVLKKKMIDVNTNQFCLKLSSLNMIIISNCIVEDDAIKAPRTT